MSSYYYSAETGQYVGNWSPYEDVPATEYGACSHEWVNVSFMGLKYVCKYCDKEKTDAHG